MKDFIIGLAIISITFLGGGSFLVWYAEAYQEMVVELKDS
jgi:hypothetical protein